MQINALLVLWSGGWRERTDWAAISGGMRVEALMGLGACQSGAEADRIADQQLALYSAARTEIVVGVEPVGEADTPYLAYLPGDTVTFQGGVERVTGVAVAEDDDGRVTFAPQLRANIFTEQERLDQAVKKMSNGTIRGDSQVATPAHLVNTRPSGPNCCPPDYVPPSEPSSGSG